MRRHADLLLCLVTLLCSLMPIGLSVDPALVAPAKSMDATFISFVPLIAAAMLVGTVILAVWRGFFWVKSQKYEPVVIYVVATFVLGYGGIALGVKVRSSFAEEADREFQKVRLQLPYSAMAFSPELEPQSKALLAALRDAQIRLLQVHSAPWQSSYEYKFEGRPDDSVRISFQTSRRVPRLQVYDVGLSLERLSRKKD